MASRELKVARPTLEQVGEEAGVSRATVSRVINNSPKVSPEVRAAVERAIAKLSYSPNQAARSLVTRRTDAIALVVCEPEEQFFADPFFAAVVRGLGSITAEVDKNLVLMVMQGEAERERARRYLRPEHVDGVVLMSLHGEDPLPRQLQRHGSASSSRSSRKAISARREATRRRSGCSRAGPTSTVSSPRPT